VRIIPVLGGEQLETITAKSAKNAKGAKMNW
jgi:hypothetical protein